jgi:hypothetical protein
VEWLLNAKARKNLRGWLRDLHDCRRLTGIFPTHDQAEAMADRVALLRAGRIEQVDVRASCMPSRRVFSYLSPWAKPSDRPAVRFGIGGNSRLASLGKDWFVPNGEPFVSSLAVVLQRRICFLIATMFASCHRSAADPPRMKPGRRRFPMRRGGQRLTIHDSLSSSVIRRTPAFDLTLRGALTTG